jgi:hypothetical protein
MVEVQWSRDRYVRNAATGPVCALSVFGRATHMQDSIVRFLHLYPFDSRSVATQRSSSLSLYEWTPYPHEYPIEYPQDSGSVHRTWILQYPHEESSQKVSRSSIHAIKYPHPYPHAYPYILALVKPCVRIFIVDEFTEYPHRTSQS